LWTFVSSCLRGKNVWKFTALSFKGRTQKWIIKLYHSEWITAGQKVRDFAGTTAIRPQTTGTIWFSIEIELAFNRSRFYKLRLEKPLPEKLRFGYTNIQRWANYQILETKFPGQGTAAECWNEKQGNVPDGPHLPGGVHLSALLLSFTNSVWESYCLRNSVSGTRIFKDARITKYWKRSFRRKFLPKRSFGRRSKGMYQMAPTSQVEAIFRHTKSRLGEFNMTDAFNFLQDVKFFIDNASKIFYIEIRISSIKT
jgi:hypothetical protein